VPSNNFKKYTEEHFCLKFIPSGTTPKFNTINSKLLPWKRSTCSLTQFPSWHARQLRPILILLSCLYWTHWSRGSVLQLYLGGLRFKTWWDNQQWWLKFLVVFIGLLLRHTLMAPTAPCQTAIPTNYWFTGDWILTLICSNKYAPLVFIRPNATVCISVYSGTSFTHFRYCMQPSVLCC
jgi:hypothetical protein